MNGKQHFKVGIGAGIGTGICLMSMQPYGVIPAAGAIVGGVVAALASKLPDIDHNNSKLGRVRHKVTKTSNAIFNLVAIGLALITGALALNGKSEVMGVSVPMDLLWKISGGTIILMLVKKSLSANKTVKWMTAHRGFMHTLILPIAFGTAAWIIPIAFVRRILIGLTVGYFCHLDADMYTVDGCPLAFPLSKHSFRKANPKKSTDTKLDRVAGRLSRRYVILGIIAAVLCKFLGL